MNNPVGFYYWGNFSLFSRFQVDILTEGKIRDSCIPIASLPDANDSHMLQTNILIGTPFAIIALFFLLGVFWYWRCWKKGNVNFLLRFIFHNSSWHFHVIAALPSQLFNSSYWHSSLYYWIIFDFLTHAFVLLWMYFFIRSAPQLPTPFHLCINCTSDSETMSCYILVISYLSLRSLNFHLKELFFHNIVFIFKCNPSL
jgi:hypothetical protein